SRSRHASSKRDWSSDVCSSDLAKNNSADLPEQLRIRREKRQRILDSGKDAYPVEVDRTISITELREKYVVGEGDAEGVTYLAAEIGRASGREGVVVESGAVSAE